MFFLLYSKQIYILLLTVIMTSEYETGVALLNYEGYDDNFLQYALPFSEEAILSLTKVNVDDDLMFPIANSNVLIDPLNKCKSVKKLTYGGKLLTIEGQFLYSLLDCLYAHYKSLECYLETYRINMDYCYRLVDELHIDTQTQFIVKVQPIKTVRKLLTCVKEVNIMHDIYHSKWGHLLGSDIIPQPIGGFPWWNGKKWRYITIMEKVEGVPLSKTTTLLYSLWNRKMFNKHNILNSVVQTITNFWTLGYSHNDLHFDNVIYDIKTNTAKIIDLETAVKIPNNHVEKFRKHLATNIIQSMSFNSINNLSCLSNLHKTYYKLPSLSLLYKASKYCERYEDEDNRIYNVDEYILPILREHFRV